MPYEVSREELEGFGLSSHHLFAPEAVAQPHHTSTALEYAKLIHPYRHLRNLPISPNAKIGIMDEIQRLEFNPIALRRAHGLIWFNPALD
jgi:hypothetical protein